MSFSGLFGNNRTKDVLTRAVLLGTVPHAFLIDGGEGSGKLTLARELSMALNCERRAKGDVPCHACPTCKRIEKGEHVDIHILEKQSGKATLGVDEVKELRRDMYLSATEAEHKVYIIRDAERLTTEAQNSLLIVLEEPPKNVTIMLLASGTDRILTTIKSRAQYIAMERHSAADIEGYLLSRSEAAVKLKRDDPEALALILSAADGRIGVALELLDPERQRALAESREETSNILFAMRSGAPFSELYSALRALPKNRTELGDSLERLISGVADLILIKYDSEADLSFFIDRKGAAELADSIGRDRLYRIFDALGRAHEANTKNANTTALITSLTSAIFEA